MTLAEIQRVLEAAGFHNATRGYRAAEIGAKERRHMTDNALKLQSLKRGDVVRHANGDSYIVIVGATKDMPAIAISELTVSNPQEWTIVKQHDWT